jgi:hypothetical protein
MQYINPIEILEFSKVVDISQIDSDSIKKAKRKLFADIDLSDDGHFNYYGIKLSKGECEKAINELSNNDLKDFYFYLNSNKKLNQFLINGNKNLFSSFKQDSILKLNEFVNFISPYYTEKFNKAVSNAFEDEDIDLLKSILKTSFLISQKDINTAFKSVTNILQNRLAELSEIRTDIKNEESIYDNDDIHEVLDLVIEYFPTESLNCLPNYFQSQILKIANEINYLNVAIWDNFDNTQVSQDLLEHILTLNIDGLNKPTFQKNYEIVKRKNEERIEEERNAPILRKYAGYLIQSKSKIQEIENKTLIPSSLLSWVNSSISIPDLNRLPQTFAEIKNQIALSLRAMSVEVWNSYSNIDVSIDLINKANSITGLKSETLGNILDAKKQLTELKTKIDTANLGRQRTASAPTQTRTTTTTRAVSDSSSNNNSGCLWLIGIAIVIGIIIAISDSNKPSSSDNNYSNDNSYNSPTTTPVEENLTPVESEYKGNQLNDGASPLNECFGEGIYNGNATLTIDNGGSSDAIVCLYSIENGRTIRNEYVRKNSKFTMSNIAQGNYKIRVFYGNDWNPFLTNSCGTKGNFESDVHFSEFDGTEYFEDSERGYTTATITLYTVAGGNAPSSSIDQSTFFNK